MPQDIHSFIERYQLLYEKDPKSKVFAPLAEAYRRMGLIDEAIDLAESGVKEHPNFASGRVALGKCYVQKQKYAEGAEELKIAAELSPENLLAHQLLAECYTRLDRPVEAMNAYKIVLFLNPNDARVSQIVKDLETKIYAGASKGEFKDVEFEEEYEMAPLQTVQKSERPDKDSLKKQPGAKDDVNRDIALFDSRFNRADWDVARVQLQDMLKKYPQHPEVLKRKTYFDELTQGSLGATVWMAPLTPEELNPKIKKLEKLLMQIEERAHKT